MRLEINGQTQQVQDGDGLRPLLQVLREELRITSPKPGCQEGSCGTCTVLVDGAPRRACLVPAAAAADKSIATVEGLGDSDDLHPVQEAFHECYAAQCGYCTPGMIMAAVALLQRSAEPSDAEIAEALQGHVCRCTGYVKIRDAVRAAASTQDSTEVSV